MLQCTGGRRRRGNRALGLRVTGCNNVPFSFVTAQLGCEATTKKKRATANRREKVAAAAVHSPEHRKVLKLSLAFALKSAVLISHSFYL